MTAPVVETDAIVLGAGAAGLMCAAVAGKRGRRVVLIEHTDKAGAKILISGGGRCNFTNLHIAPQRFLSENPHFCRSALSRYTQADFVALVEQYGIAYHEKTLGQLFCDGSARSIVGMLLAECAAGGVDLRLGERVTDVARNDRFEVATTSRRYRAPKLVLATGGLSIPKMGATGLAHELARRFGLRLVEPRPGLVPFRLGAGTEVFDPSLAGLSLDVSVSLAATTFREAMLFTHRGLSGPAILQISSYWQPGAAISIDLLPDRDPLALMKDRRLTRPRASLPTILAEVLPERLARALVSGDGGSKDLANTPDRALEALAARLKSWAVTPTGTEGYAKAEVTVGGIDTRDLSSKTMEANAVPGLYAIGEAVDVTGWLGGYNFQWAWSSGWCAGEAL